MRTPRTKPMSQSRLIALPCRISRGVVSDERAFEIRLAEGPSHVSVAPVFYFWTVQGVPLTKEEPSGDQEIDGKVAARLLERRNGTALVSIPDGSVVAVDGSAIQERPSQVVFDVSL